MEIAIFAAEEYQFSKLEEFSEYKRIKEYDDKYIREIENHSLLRILNILLLHGLDPKESLEYINDNSDINVMDTLRYVDQPFLAGKAMRLLLNNGANSNMLINDCERLFWDIDSDIAMDIDLLPYDIPLSFFQCWLVLIGYGAKPEHTIPFDLNPGHSYEELREFENYDFFIRYDSEKKENIMHWYLEDIDVHYMTECWEKECDNDYLNGLVKTAMVLIKKGGLRNFCGYSLYVDEKGHGSIRPAELKY